MPISLRQSTAKDHEKLPERKKQSTMNPVLLEAIQLIKSGKVAQIGYETEQERNNTVRQMGRLAAREGITIDIRYPETGQYVSIRQGTEPYVPRERKSSGNGRRRTQADNETVS